MTAARLTRDPAHEPLREVRRGLLRLHKALIDAERAVFESERGPLTPSEFLQALMEDPFFQWLRPFSGLIVEIDGALADRDRGVSSKDARAFVQRVATLVGPSLGVFTTARLDEVRRREPGVQFIHIELTQSIGRALDAYPE